MATKFEKQVLAALTAGLETMLEQLWKIDTDAPDDDAQQNPLFVEPPRQETLPLNGIAEPPRTVGQAIEQARSAPRPVHTPAQSPMAEAVAADETLDLLGSRLPYKRLTATEVAEAVKRWEESTGDVRDRFDSLLLEFARDTSTMLSILKGEHPYSPRRARGAIDDVPTKERTFLKRADALNLRSDFVRVCATRQPTTKDVVRLSIRYNVSVATAVTILRGKHRSLAGGGAA